MKAIFRNIQNCLLDELDQAKDTIEIAVAWFTNVTLMDCLLNRLSKGVKVTIIINNDEINNNDTNKSHLINLLKKGCEIHWINYPELMHQKFCIIDSRIVANGSYNWTYYAECHNRENIVFLEDHEIITAFKREFERLTMLYPALDSIPNVGKSNFENSLIKRIKESETQSAQKHQKDIPDYSITTIWHNQSSINMRLTSKNDFITIVRRKPKSIERVFDADLENNEYSCFFNECPNYYSEIEKERHLFKVFVESASGDIQFHIDDNDKENFDTNIPFEKDAGYAILVYSSYQINSNSNHHDAFRYKKYNILVNVKVKTNCYDSLGMSIENMVGVKERVTLGSNDCIKYNSIPDGNCYYIVLRPTTDIDDCIVEAESCGRSQKWHINVKAGIVYYLGYICNLSHKYKTKKIFIEKGIKK